MFPLIGDDSIFVNYVPPVSLTSRVHTGLLLRVLSQVTADRSFNLHVKKEKKKVRLRLVARWTLDLLWSRTRTYSHIILMSGLNWSPASLILERVKLMLQQGNFRSKY